MTNSEAYVCCVALASISPTGMILHPRYMMRNLPSPHELLNALAAEHSIDITAEAFNIDVQRAVTDVLNDCDEDMLEDERRELGN